MLEIEPSSGVHKASYTVAPCTITPYYTSPSIPTIPTILFLPPHSQDISRLGAPLFSLKGQAVLAFPFPRGHLWPVSVHWLQSPLHPQDSFPHTFPSSQAWGREGLQNPLPQGPPEQGARVPALLQTLPGSVTALTVLAAGVGRPELHGAPGVRRAQARASQQVAGAGSRCWGPDPGARVGRMTCPRRGGSRGGVTGVLGNSGTADPAPALPAGGRTPCRAGTPAPVLLAPSRVAAREARGGPAPPPETPEHSLRCPAAPDAQRSAWGGVRWVGRTGQCQVGGGHRERGIYPRELRCQLPELRTGLEKQTFCKPAS